MSEFLEFAKVFGVPFALVVFFVWQAWMRERRTDAQLAEMRRFIQSRLIGLSEESKGAVETCNHSMSSVAASLTTLSAAVADLAAATKIMLAKVDSRPCITEPR